MDDREKSRLAKDLLVLGLAIAVASILIPAIFPSQIPVSPLVLFGIVFLSNASQFFVPAGDKEGSGRMFSALFYGRIALSLILSALLIYIYQFASGLD